MIRWGIVGLGKMANNFAISLKEIDNAKLVKVASLSKSRLIKFSKNFNINDNNRYNNYDELFCSNEIDAIYIASLNNTHLDIIKKCAENKKNILCEKPFVTSHQEAKIAFDYIKKYKINFYEAIAYITHQQTRVIKEIIDSDEIGQINRIKLNFGFKAGKIKPESRLFNKELGGGSLLDLGCYPLSFLNLLFNDRNNYQFDSVKGGYTSTGVDDFAEAKITINDSIDCFIKVSIKENLDNKIIINGSKGVLVINHPWIPEKKSSVDIKVGNSFYKRFINSKLSLYAGQIKTVSDNFDKKINNDKFSVNINDSLHIMKNLSLWANLIENR